MAERPGIKVLVISGVDIRKIMHKASMPFLPKPFDGETLKAKVRKILSAPEKPENDSETSGLPGMNPAPPD
jgi:DNA-binding NtrC family response regulator